MSAFSEYYREDLKKFFKQIIPSGSKVCYDPKNIKGKYDYIILPNSLAFLDDIQSYLKKLKRNCHSKTRIVVVYFNLFWKPILDTAAFLGLSQKSDKESNWLSVDDITNLFSLEEYGEVKKGRRLLLPYNLGPISTLFNKYLGKLPLINQFCLTTYQIYRPKVKERDYSVSLVIPARNEQGNMKNIFKKIPKFAKKMEYIFVEGHSTDGTFKTIKEEIEKNKDKKAFLYKQRGKGKADAVRLGFNKAKNDILIILDADLTVDPRDLIKFYNAISKGHCEFVNGSRLVYAMEKEAMQTLNFFGNKFFSLAFSYLLDQRITDTLCGTKVLLRKDYERISKNRKYFGDFDPFGDYDLLFGATKLNLKISDIPVRYRERVYGSTNISRFIHGWLLIKMTLFAAKKIKFI